MITFTICENCEGEGWTPEPYCCMRLGDCGECCGVPYWEQVECPKCTSGVIIDEQTNINQDEI